MKSKYKVIHDEILKAILQGEYVFKMKIPTEYALMQKYGVSRITAQKALNTLEESGYITRHPGKGSFVNSLEKMPDEQAAEIPDMDFKKQPDFISLIITNNVQQISTIIHGIAQVVTPMGYQISISTTQNDPDLEKKAVMTALQSGSKGIIIYTSDFSNKNLMTSLIYNKKPLVFLDNSYLPLPCNCITTDGFSGGFELTEHLISKNHTRIGFASIEPFVLDTVQDRYNGFCAAMEKHNIPVNPEYIFRSKSESHFRTAVCSTKLPSAMFCCSDNVAFLVYNIAVQLGLNLPNDLSVVGFDDSPICTQLAPTLTSISQPFQTIGEEAARTLLAQINGNDEKCKKYLPVKLIERESVTDLKI